MALLIIVIAAAVISIIGARAHPGQIPSILGYRFMSVLTGSMRPELEPGDMAVVKTISPEKIKPGDIITFKMDGNMLVTHRVINVDDRGGSLMFETKGDANNVKDEKQVSPEQIVGVMVFSIPYGGYVTSFIKTRPGIIIAIMIPAILLTLLELKTILSEFKNDRHENDADLQDNMDNI